jgi:hypothetical protein
MRERSFEFGLSGARSILHPPVIAHASVSPGIDVPSDRPAMTPEAQKSSARNEARGSS